MSEPQKTFYLTTPIYYVNARPHIGHAYTTLAADTIARRQRLQLGNDNVYFLTGTDEHGQKVQRSAEAAGISPQQFTDQVSATFLALWDRMGITYNDYIRTTEPRHAQGVQALFNRLYEGGHIELNSYTGSYCVSDEAFMDLPVGTPCPDCGRLLELVTEENFFFKLSNYQLQLIDLIESGRFAVEPEARRNEVLSFLRGNVNAATDPDATNLGAPSTPQSGVGGNLAYSAQGTPYLPGALKDLSISRSSFDWGIPVPEPAASLSKQKHVIYVWLDALANYMTALGYGQDTATNPGAPSTPQSGVGGNLFEKFWPADLHLVGKEIIRFHCIYWPAFLLAAGLPLPKKVQAHGWLLFEESKMSKSRGNIVRAESILDAFGSLKPEASKQEQDLFGTDVLRYFLLREIPFGNDGSFSFDALVQRYNSDLANGYGNLVSRTLAMIEKYFGEIPPAGVPLPRNAREGSEPSNYDFGTQLQSIWSEIASTDGYLTSNVPWKLAADETKRSLLAEVLYYAAEAIRHITAALYPYLPNTTAKVWAQLGLGNIEESAQKGELTNLQWGGLKPGTKLGTLGPIFPRAPKELIQTMTDSEQKPAENAPNSAENAVLSAPNDTRIDETPAEVSPGIAPIAPVITIDDFAKLDLRVAKVLSVERIPKADKLLKLQVDLGFEQRQILSGIAEFYEPEALVGRKVVIVANLAPRKMRGLESNGMIVAASVGDHGHPYLASFLEDVPLGARLK
ncbi:methionine--tRNA ligase subunit beta [Terriglobus tenax]|uniref:methionine--tRNA ligase subunit beta n=1 Tax=Terriglobus tenax TaxID=1111115 RepID=UPI0021DFADC9|nr:methionine--tRNA ligase subunit beta [Terriglobus tenax]